jgi:hypothetical protein
MSIIFRSILLYRLKAVLREYLLINSNRANNMDNKEPNILHDDDDDDVVAALPCIPRYRDRRNAVFDYYDRIKMLLKLY